MSNPAKSKSTGIAGQTNGGHRSQMTPSGQRSVTPFSAPFHRLRSEFDRLFDNFMHGFPATWEGDSQDGWGLNVQESNDAVVIRADVPGFEPDDFDIEVRGDTLVVCASQSEEKSHDKEGYRWENREFFRSVPLPTGVDVDKVDAEYHNGVLSVKLPKNEQAKGKKIQVKG